MNANTINDDVTVAGEAAQALLMNRYRIIKQLGQGGMGSVWLAEDVQLDGKLFAIKMLPSIFVSNKRAYQQLKAEALVSMKLIHPNIVTLRAFEENDGNPFLVMDYIRGKNLDDCITEWGVLGEAEVKMLLKPIAEALDYAHSKGVVHRDIKPSNVMITEDHTPYILDFGIAREIQETMTRVTGKLSSGTLLYMSPEQLNGDAPKAPQDVYSFAAMVYECIKGHPPFYRGQIEYQIMHSTPASLEGESCCVSSSFAASVMAGLAKIPDRRPHSCVAVLGCGSAFRIQSAFRGVTAKAVAGRGSYGEKMPEIRPYRRRLAAFLAAGLGFLVLCIVALFWNPKEEGDLKQQAAMEEVMRIAEETRRDAGKLKLEVDAAKRMAKEAKRKQDEASRVAEEARRKEAEVNRMAEEARRKPAEASRVAMESERRAEEMRLKTQNDKLKAGKSDEVERLEEEGIVPKKNAESERASNAKSICKQCHGTGSLWNRLSCEICDGRAFVDRTEVCPQCKGTGRWTVSDVCPVCSGRRKRRQDCSSCRNRGTIACSVCNGAGGTMVSRYVRGINGHNRALRKVKEDCYHCNGRGRVACSSCNGGVLEDCGRCNASGLVLKSGNCNDCSGTGKETKKIRCDACEEGYRYCTQTCSFCDGKGVRTLYGDEKEDLFDGISVDSPVAVEYLPFSLDHVVRIPQGWRARFLFHGDGSSDSSGKIHFSVKTGEEIGSSGWIFVSYEQKTVQKEVPGVSGMFRSVDVSEAVLARMSDGKRVCLIIGAKERVQIDVKAMLHVCGKDGKKEKFVAKEAMTFNLDGHMFVIRDVGLAAVVVEDMQSKKTKAVKPECCGDRQK